MNLPEKTKTVEESGRHDSPGERALDSASEMSFPASDPIAFSNITRIETAPDMSDAAGDHPIGLVEVSPKAKTGHALDHLKIAALVTDGFEQSELLEPKKALEAMGAQVDVISDHDGTVQGYRHLEKGASVKVDKPLSGLHAQDYAGVLLPGGVVNGDAMRMRKEAQEFIRQMDQAKKPIAAICHGGWLLISAGVAGHRTLTSWPSMKDDFRNAGSTWVDREVVRDDNLVSSRKPDDIPAFNDAFISLLRSEKANAMVGR